MSDIYQGVHPYPPQPVVTPPAVNFGGTWYGVIPPDNPELGWFWFNMNTFGLYICDDSGVWVQVGTNW